MFMIKEMPEQMRPRERFLQHPIEMISNQELLAIILRTGSKQESVLDLSNRVLYEFKSLKELSNASIKELKSIKGIGTVKAIEIKTCFELGKRASQEPFIEKTKLQSPESIYLYLKDQLELKTQEHLIALYLNAKGELLTKKTLFIGSLNSSLIHPREIFKYAVINSAASIIIVHNHPSGDPTPSKNDIDVTKLIHKNSLMMDIELLDHIIIGRDRYYSFKEKRII